MRGGMIEIGGQARTVGAERMELRQELFLVAVGLAAALHRGGQTIERLRQAFCRCIDCASVGHRSSFGLKKRVNEQGFRGRSLIRRFSGVNAARGNTMPPVQSAARCAHTTLDSWAS